MPSYPLQVLSHFLQVALRADLYKTPLLVPVVRLASLRMCYDNYAKNCVSYGRLYTWSAAMDSAGVFSQNALGCGRNAECSASGKVRGVCPEGWHLPDSTEILALLKYMECEKDETLANAYDHCASRLKSTSDWHGGEGTDDYGFTALAAGMYQGNSVRCLKD